VAEFSNASLGVGSLSEGIMLAKSHVVSALSWEAFFGRAALSEEPR
jgi:hypothetical protein